MSPFGRADVTSSAAGQAACGGTPQRRVLSLAANATSTREISGLEGYNAEIRDQLTILSPVKNQGVADVLLKEAHKGQYGCLILGRRGGLAKARRRIFGSVSETLLDALPGRTFGIVG